MGTLVVPLFVLFCPVLSAFSRHPPLAIFTTNWQIISGLALFFTVILVIPLGLFCVAIALFFSVSRLGGYLFVAHTAFQ